MRKLFYTAFIIIELLSAFYSKAQSQLPISNNIGIALSQKQIEEILNICHKNNITTFKRIEIGQISVPNMDIDSTIIEVLEELKWNNYLASQKYLEIKVNYWDRTPKHHSKIKSQFAFKKISVDKFIRILLEKDIYVVLDYPLNVSYEEAKELLLMLKSGSYCITDAVFKNYQVNVMDISSLRKTKKGFIIRIPGNGNFEFLCKKKNDKLYLTFFSSVVP